MQTRAFLLAEPLQSFEWGGRSKSREELYQQMNNNESGKTPPALPENLEKPHKETG